MGTAASLVVDPASGPSDSDLAETWFLEHAEPAIGHLVDEVTAGLDTDATRASAIFAAV